MRRLHRPSIDQGVDDGSRTRNPPLHRRVLYQLSYEHHVWLPPKGSNLGFPIQIRASFR
jgi:hypothetical protein